MRNILIVLISCLLLSSCMTDNRCKKYVINHKSEICKINSINYIINDCNFKYIEDITISKYYDSSYTIIFWNDRKTNIGWYIRSDKKISVDVDYKKYKKQNTILDEKILNIINNIK